MATSQWAVDFATKVAKYMDRVGIENVNFKNFTKGLAAHIDDEIPGYCDDCEFRDSDDRDREPSAVDEAKISGSWRG